MEKELDKEKIIDKMRELREKRFQELIEKSKGRTLNDYIKNIKYLDTLEINGEEKSIYLLEEQHKQKDGSFTKIEKYYTEDGEFLGGNNSSDQYSKAILSEKYEENSELLEKLQRIEESEKEGKLDLEKEDEKLIEEVSKELGIEKEKVKKISLIDAKEQIKGKNKAQDENEEEKDDKQDNKENKISKEKIEKISSKQEIKSNERVTDQETMQEILGVEDKNYTKFAIIYSDKLEGNNNTTKYTIAGINKDGTAEKIDTLEQDYGKNPTKEIYQMNEDGSEIKKQQVNSIYRIKGKEEGQIAIRNGSMGEIEPSYVRTPRQANQKGISIPIETQNIRPTTREMQETMNRNRDTDVKDNINRAEEHEKNNCHDMKKQDIDDNMHNNTHIHELNDEELNRMAKRLMKNDNIAEVYNIEDAKKVILNEIKVSNNNGEKITIEELEKKTETKMEDNAEEEHQLPT